MLDSFSVCFLTPTTAPGIQLCNLSSGSATKIHIELRSSSSSSVSLLLDLHSLFLCDLGKKKRKHSNILCLCYHSPVFRRSLPFCTSLRPPQPLCEWDAATASLLAFLALFLSLLVCDKTLGPVVFLIELWDHISAALEELDRLSMALRRLPHTH